MKIKRLLELAGKVNEDFSDAEHYNKKGAGREKFKGRTIIITDLYDGDVFGFLGNSRFVVSTPLDRGDGGGTGHVTADEVTVSDIDNSLSRKDIAFLKQWTLSQMNESVATGIQINENEPTDREVLETVYNILDEIAGPDSDADSVEVEDALERIMKVVKNQLLLKGTTGV